MGGTTIQVPHCALGDMTYVFAAGAAGGQRGVQVRLHRGGLRRCQRAALLPHYACSTRQRIVSADLHISCMMMHTTAGYRFSEPFVLSHTGFKELHDKFRGQPFEIVGEQLGYGVMS